MRGQVLHVGFRPEQAGIGDAICLSEVARFA
jgi:hypothetical protein